MDIWERERALAWTTIGWGGVSLAAGLVGTALSRDPWRRSFGQQTAGWGAVDLAIAAVGLQLQQRRMEARPDAYAAEVQETERVKLRRILWVNVAADLGYVALGGVLARDPRPRTSGAGAAIIVQGTFLLAHDAFHAIGARPA